jgi:hypothetical protein
MSEAKDKRVEVYIPRGGAHEEENFFVGVNGTSYLLPRGKKSMVPAEVAAEIKRAFAAQDTKDENIGKLLEAAK